VSVVVVDSLALADSLRAVESPEPNVESVRVRSVGGSVDSDWVPFVPESGLSVWASVPVDSKDSDWCEPALLDAEVESLDVDVDSAAARGPASSLSPPSASESVDVDPGSISVSSGADRPLGA